MFTMMKDEMEFVIKVNYIGEINANWQFKVLYIQLYSSQKMRLSHLVTAFKLYSRRVCKEKTISTKEEGWRSSNFLGGPTQGVLELPLGCAVSKLVLPQGFVDYTEQLINCGQPSTHIICLGIIGWQPQTMSHDT